MNGHPAAELFPLMSEAALQPLVDSMKQHGFDPEKPILIYGAQILDGRNRFRAAQIAGVTPVIKDVSATVEDPWLESWKQNGARRDLEPDQKAAIRIRLLEHSDEWRQQQQERKRKANEARAEKVAEAVKEQPRDASGKVAPKPSAASREAGPGKKDSDHDRATKAIARDAGVSRSTVERVLSLKSKDPQAFEKVVRGEAKAAAELRATQKRAAIKRISEEPEPMPAGPFRVIVADPPWDYNKRADDGTHRVGNPYPTMTTEQLCAMPVRELAHPDGCVLWLWTTNAFMRDAFQILDAWGFQEKTILTWVKNRMGLGDWLRGKTEHCILAVRGKPTVNLATQTTALVADVREHSRKPDEFYTVVETLCPGSKVELFARQKRTGWKSWGAETEKFAVSPANDTESKTA